MNAYLRIIDANFNRTKEALRTCEELARFLLEDKVLTLKFKALRHEVSQILIAFPVKYRQLVEARDSIKDVGKKSSIQDTKKKPVWQDVMISNLKRSQESLRVLEEFSKVVAPKSSSKFQKIRFDLYVLEKRTVKKF